MYWVQSKYLCKQNLLKQRKTQTYSSNTSNASLKYFVNVSQKTGLENFILFSALSCPKEEVKALLFIIFELEWIRCQESKCREQFNFENRMKYMSFSISNIYNFWHNYYQKWNFSRILKHYFKRFFLTRDSWSPGDYSFGKHMKNKIWFGAKKEINISYSEFKVAFGALRGIHVC